ncbi:TonB C-terminal domain-containing protein [Burkholderia plantarii]|uniref:TonB C-terminal domain-containing protein n=1 Tax=Burkholderia plantarii TaxID=41899 RepID=UPI0006D89452|nr:TonB C-terminal domain-containing protein [Burkholderia plantarii]ALK34224.1 TonB-ferrisiderophore receptor protein [Burkholderia plantarii]
MTRFRPPAGLFALLACLWLLAWPACRAAAQTVSAPSDAGPPAAGTARFDLPAQPLARALQSFARVTELVVLAPAPLLEGRMSAPLEGDYAPRDALRRVLVGTGLRADFTQPDEAIIVADPASRGLAATPTDNGSDGALPVDGIEGSAERRAFAGTLQERMIEALCAQPAAVPGSYRFVAQLRMDEKGAVVAVNKVTSSGQAVRDAAILRALRALQLDTAPPAGLPQPVTILLRPTGNGVHFRCPSAAGGN